MIELEINGMLSTVAVTSLKAYNFLSAGAMLAVYPIKQHPTSFTFFMNYSSSILV